jgi:hypothetical protein
MTDEDQANLCDQLRRLPAVWDEVGCDAADEIERLASELRLAIGARDYANDLLAQVRERLELRISELERKAPW